MGTSTARRDRGEGSLFYGARQLRELRHTFVSVLPAKGVPIEAIADAVGHINFTVTRSSYRHTIRDVSAASAAVWDSEEEAAR